MMTRSKSTLAWFGLLVVGCSSDSDNEVPLPGSVPDAGSELQPAGATPPGSNPPGASSEGTRFDELDPSEADDIGETCFGETRAAEQIGLDLFIMLDTSGSMLDPLPAQAAGAAPTTKWDSVRGALEAFVQSPDTADIGIGLQYFPQIEAGVPFSCDTNDQCGAAGPCSNSLCVVAVSRDDNPADLNPPLTFLRVVQTRLFNVGDAAGCSADATGWYYVNDPSGVPLQIRVCPSACQVLQNGETTAELQIGCATLIR